MKRLTTCLIVLFAFITAVIVAGCGSSSSGSSSGGESAETVTIGLLVENSGAIAADGKLGQKGAELAVEEINKAGGIDGMELALKVADVGEGNPDVVARQVQELISDSSVKAVITGVASTTNFEIEPLGRAGMPYLIGGAAEQTEAIIAKDPEAYGTVWSMAPSYEAYGTELPKKVDEWIKQGDVKLPSHSAYVVTSQNPYSEGISDGLVKTMEETGWDVKGEETVPLTEINDWSTVLAKIRAAEPGLIINTDYQPANEATFMQQFVENPTDSLVFIQYGPSVPEFLELTGNVSSGVLYNQLLGAIDTKNWPPGQQFVAKFKEAYGEEPGVYGSDLYDSVQVYAAALEKVGNADEKAAIGEALGETSLDTSQGHIEFDPKTHLAKEGDELTPLQFFQIRDGKRILLAPEKLAAGQVEPPPWMEGK